MDDIEHTLHDNNALHVMSDVELVLCSFPDVGSWHLYRCKPSTLPVAQLRLFFATRASHVICIGRTVAHDDGSRLFLCRLHDMPSTKPQPFLFISASASSPPDPGIDSGVVSKSASGLTCLPVSCARIVSSILWLVSFSAPFVRLRSEGECQ